MSCAASHSERLDSIQRQALRLVDAAHPQPNQRLPAPSRSTSRRLLCSTRHRCRECHTWRAYANLRESPRGTPERCYPVVTQWRCRVPAPASTNAPLRVESPSSFPGNEHPGGKTGGPPLEKFNPHSTNTCSGLVTQCSVCIYVYV